MGLLTVLGVGVAVWFLGTHTVIFTDDGVKMSSKGRFGFDDLFVDVRDWSPLEYARNPRIATDLGIQEIRDWQQSDAGQQTAEYLREAGDQVNEAAQALQKWINTR